MKTRAERDTIKTITTHYIDGAFVESHGREVLDIIRPTDGQVIARVTLADEEDTRRAIAAARRAFAIAASQPRMNARRFCVGCMRPLRRDSAILPPPWWKNTAVSSSLLD